MSSTISGEPDKNRMELGVVAPAPSVFEEILGRERGNDAIALLGKAPLSYGELLTKASRYAKGLKAVGVEERSLVGICLPHGDDYCAAQLGVAQMRAVAVMVDPLATIAEQRALIEDAGASFVIAARTGIGSQFGSILTWCADIEGASCFRRGSETVGGERGDAVIIYTSGTTGKSKGVVLSGSAISNNVRAVADYLALSPGDRGLVFTPPALAFAISQILSHLWVRASVRLWSQGLMFAKSLLTQIEALGITGVACNPTSARVLLRNAAGSGNSVRYFMSGGQPLIGDDVRLICCAFPQCRVVNMYGCTENSPRVSFHWLPEQNRRSDAIPFPVGQCVRGSRIKVIDDAGHDVSCGETGEVLVSGKSLASRYWNNQSLTEERFKQGWFHTRDLGRIDSDGNLNLVGRLDTVLNVGHFKVSPEEIENVICRTPGIREVGVVGQEDQLLGMVPVALVVLEDSLSGVLQEAHKVCCEALSRQKIPKRFIPVDAIPRTPYGKIDRVRLKALAQAYTL